MPNILITTAIGYPNSGPHVGHMYEAILADIINRAYILKGNNSGLLTGTDEHGKKIQMKAREMNMSPKELCDINSSLFKEMLFKIGVKYDRFIRTTDHDHIELVEESISNAVGFINKGTYSGYYNVREETFITETEALETDYKDPITGIPYEIRNEESYFFKLSDFKDFIISKLDRVIGFNTDSFEDRLKNLQDLSISRVKTEEFDWGIDIPFDSTHIVYVWFDALLNYITGQKFLFDNYSSMIHVIGKDIVWFHTVIYPAILLSNGYNIYDKIFVHGFILDEDGKKMSKSLNNVVTPNELLEEYPVDAIRFYLFMETGVGNDIKFSKKRLEEIYNTILVDKFYNLFNRFYKLVSDINFPFEKFTLNEDFYLDPLDFNRIKSDLMGKLSFCNNNITEKEIWKPIFRNQKLEFMETIIGQSFYEALCILSLIIPDKVKELNSYLGFNIPGVKYEIKPVYNYIPNLKTFTKLNKK